MDITPDNSQQLSIFENSNPRYKLLMKIIDKLNKFRYKTRLSEIISVKT